MIKKQKKAQIAIFILLGIVILIAASFLFYFNPSRESEIEKISQFPTEIIPIKNYVETCISEVGEDASIFISKQGGYYNFIETFFDSGRESTSYHFYYNKSVIPSLETIQEEFSRYLNEHLSDCLDNFSIFKKQGFEITGEYLNTTIIMSDKKSDIFLDYPLKITKGETYTEISRFSAVLPYSLKKFHDFSGEFVKELMQDSSSICISCLNDLSLKYDLYSSMYDIGDPDILFVVIDNNSIIDGKVLEFSFAIRLPPFFDIKEELFEIINVKDQESYIGYEYSYQVNTTKPAANFSDNTPLFDINPDTGFISFIPNDKQVGTHLIKIDAINTEGNKDFELFKLTIKNFNYNPRIEYIGYQTAEIDIPFTYQVNVSDVENNKIHFLDNSELFDISFNTGLINFTPTLDMVGSYDINITIIDEKGGKDTEQMFLFIEK